MKTLHLLIIAVTIITSIFLYQYYSDYKVCLRAYGEIDAEDICEKIK